MVKVISAYNFQEQNIHSIFGDIVAICQIDGNNLVLAHRNHHIEIVKLKSRKNSNEPNLIHDDDDIDANEEGIIDGENDSNSPSTDSDRMLNNKSTIKFPTINQVEKILYCEAGNYLLTLERQIDSSISHNNAKRDAYFSQNQSNSPQHNRNTQPNQHSQNSFVNLKSSDSTYVRIYSNYLVASRVQSSFSVPIQPRIASQVTPKLSTGDYIDVVELPIIEDQSPELIACCQVSGTVMVSCRNQLNFYELRHRFYDKTNTKRTFIDFYEFPFTIRLDFIPVHLNIAEHVVACSNQTSVVAFKIVDLSDNNTEDGSTSNSMTTDSSNQPIVHKLSDTIDFEVAKQCNQYNGIPFSVDIRSNWDHDVEKRVTFSEERPILSNDFKVVLKKTIHDGVFYSIRMLIQLKLPNENSAGIVHDQFRCLKLKPIYNKRNNNYKNLNSTKLSNTSSLTSSPTATPSTSGTSASYQHIMKSKHYNNCIGFTLFVSTVSDGYLYQFTNHGKWYSENTKCLAVYPFTAPVIDVIIDNFVIHAITESGIETYSSRIGQKLFSSYYEYPMMSDLYPKETSPLVDLPICVLGVCGFFGIRYVSATKDNLILITTDEERETQLKKSKNLNMYNNNGLDGSTIDWTIYNLKLPSSSILVDDITQIANIFQLTSPDIYFELMEEAHTISCLARRVLIGNCQGLAATSENVNKSYELIASSKENIIEETFVRTCQLLADFTVRSPRKEIYLEAVAYYTMSNHSILDIYKRFHDELNMNSKNIDSFNSDKSSDCDIVPIENTKKFNGLLYTLRVMLSEIGSNKSKGEFLTQSIDGNDTVTNTIGEDLLNLFIRLSPDDIAPICLTSSAFREILHEHLLAYFMKRNDLKRDEKLCFVLCLLYKNQANDGLIVLETMTRRDFFQTFEQYWILLFDNYNPNAINYRDKISLSDLTENIIFSSDKSNIVNGIADVFIHIIINLRAIELGCILKLFMNYFAINLGQKGYRNSQKIFEMILQGYFYDYYTINGRQIAKIGDYDIMLSQPNLYDAGNNGIGGGNVTSAAAGGGCSGGGQNSGTTGTNTVSSNSAGGAGSNCNCGTVGLQANGKNKINNYDNDNDDEDSSSSCHCLHAAKTIHDGNNRCERNNSIVSDDSIGSISNKYQQISSSNDQQSISLQHNSHNYHQHNLNSIQYQHYHHKHHNCADSNCGDVPPDFEAMKILFRMYLGLLKQHTDMQKLNPDSRIQQNLYQYTTRLIDEKSLRLSFIQALVIYRKEIKIQNEFILGYRTIIPEINNILPKYTNRSGNQFNKCMENAENSDDENFIHIRPIVFYERRERFLNRMPPFAVDSFKIDTDGILYFDNWDNEIDVILIKIQSLLSSGRLDSGLIDDFIAFVQANSDLIGIDSLLTILLPRIEAEEFLIHFYPNCLWDYAKSRSYTPHQFIGLFRRILTTKRTLSPITQTDSIKFYDGIIDDILRNLIEEKCLDEFLECIPEEEINRNPEIDNSNWKLEKYRTETQDGIDETNPFQLIMRSAIAKQRSNALNSMIRSTGRQLFDAVKNLHLFELF